MSTWGLLGDRLNMSNKSTNCLINSKWAKDLDIKPDTLNLRAEKVGE